MKPALSDGEPSDFPEPFLEFIAGIKFPIRDFWLMGGLAIFLFVPFGGGLVTAYLTVSFILGPAFVLGFLVESRSARQILRLCVFVGCLVALPFVQRSLGGAIPGDPLESLQSYQGEFFVYLFSEDEDVESYRVPATISCMTHNEFLAYLFPWVIIREYDIERIRFPGRGWREVFPGDSIVLDEKNIVVERETEQIWGVRITSDRIGEGRKGQP